MKHQAISLILLAMVLAACSRDEKTVTTNGVFNILESHAGVAEGSALHSGMNRLKPSAATITITESSNGNFDLKLEYLFEYQDGNIRQKTFSLSFQNVQSTIEGAERQFSTQVDKAVGTIDGDEFDFTNVSVQGTVGADAGNISFTGEVRGYPFSIVLDSISKSSSNSYKATPVIVEYMQFWNMTFTNASKQGCKLGFTLNGSSVTLTLSSGSESVLETYTDSDFWNECCTELEVTFDDGTTFTGTPANPDSQAYKCLELVEDKTDWYLDCGLDATIEKRPYSRLSYSVSMPGDK